MKYPRSDWNFRTCDNLTARVFSVVCGTGVSYLTLPPFPCVALLLDLYHSWHRPHTSSADDLWLRIAEPHFLYFVIKPADNSASFACFLVSVFVFRQFEKQDFK
jgi:hypothetical protein